MNVRTLVLGIRGFSAAEIKDRLNEVTRQINADAIPLDLDPGVQLTNIDPGSGGGPCAPEFIDIPTLVNGSGLPKP